MENAASVKPTMDIFERLINIFISPTETFESVRQKPAWWLPFIIVVLVGMLSSVLLFDIIKTDQQKAMIASFEKRGMTQQQIDDTMEQIEKSPFAFLVNAGPIMFIVMTPVMVAGMWAVIAGLLFLGIKLFAGGRRRETTVPAVQSGSSGSPLMDSQPTYSMVLGVVAWSSLITLVGDMLKTILIAIQHTTINVTTSVGMLMPPIPLNEKPEMFYWLLYTFMSKINPFMIWQVLLWSLGLAVVARIKPLKAGYIAFGLWGGWTVLSVAFGFFSQLITKSFM